MLNSVNGLKNVLADNHYPGRGVLWCRTGDGNALGGYFLTGRSPASKARSLHRTPEGVLIVAPSEPSAHDHLRHYVAARQSGQWLVFGNGEQVAVVAGRLDSGELPALALDGLDYEPDPPIFTPRLTVVADGQVGGRAWFGAARHSSGERTATDRLTLEVGQLEPGEGVLMTTYHSDGNEIATVDPFTEVRINAGSRRGLLDELWDSLTPQLRIAAAVFSPGGLAEADIRQKEPAQS
ncbi:IMP cyclohydrolase [Streptomyces sp. NP10]|uniref:IMP cyclohydrolase n=1 Tax=Streptomyces sp. NP10 TaxID=1141731 RepID=UPI0010035C67|nr:IMP cyclohydrolase [Streptomyces sp. NP10]RUP68676.1 IMP cyclohydrolase [Streptomyces sp. NP10]